MFSQTTSKRFRSLVFFAHQGSHDNMSYHMWWMVSILHWRSSLSQERWHAVWLSWRSKCHLPSECYRDLRPMKAEGCRPRGFLPSVDCLEMCSTTRLANSLLSSPLKLSSRMGEHLNRSPLKAQLHRHTPKHWQITFIDKRFKGKRPVAMANTSCLICRW